MSNDITAPNDISDTAADADTTTGPDLDKPVPLTKWIWGTLTMHFPGATVDRRMTLHDAHEMQQVIGNDRSGDDIAWYDSAWIQWESTKVLACTFNPDEDYGWPLTADQRRSLTKHGFRHGILPVLRDHWKTRHYEPAFSAQAVYHLHRAALDGITGSRFTALAENLEGGTGARSLKTFLDSHARQRATRNQRDDTDTPGHADTPGLHVDDIAEPDSTQPGSTGTGTTHADPDDTPAPDAGEGRQEASETEPSDTDPSDTDPDDAGSGPSDDEPNAD